MKVFVISTVVYLLLYAQPACPFESPAISKGLTIKIKRPEGFWRAF